AIDLLRGEVLLNSNRPADAIVALKRVVEARPQRESAWTLLAGAARAANDEAASIRYLEDGLRAAPNSSSIQNDLALCLASSPDKALRDPARAVVLGKQACD